MTTDTGVLSAKGLSRKFGAEQALAGVTVEFGVGEVVAVTGRSGAGKSTLLHCLGGLLRPTSGEVLFDGRPIHRLSERKLSRVRRENFGFVLQFGELIPELTLLENTELSLRLLGVERPSAKSRATKMLARLGVDSVANRYVNEVSGGQAQRAAVARALIHTPRIIFADEPTGSLDSFNAAAVIDEFLTLAREQATAVVLATHDGHLADRADRRIEMSDGCVVSVEVGR